MVRLPDPGTAPAFRGALTSLAEMRVQDFGNAVLVEPAGGAGVVRPYLSLHRLCDATTDLEDDATWAAITDSSPYGGVGAARREMLEKYSARLAAREGFAAQLNALSALVLAVEPDEIGSLLTQQLPPLFELLPEASVWWLRVDPVLIRRLALLRVRLALDLTPDVDTTPESFGGLRLLSAHSLTEGIDFGGAMAPALLAFSPGVTGFAMSKMPGAVIVMFGEPQELRVEHPAMLSSLYEPRVLHQPVTWHDPKLLDRVGLLESEQMMQWWVAALNVIYSHAADPTGFGTPLGEHDPEAQTAWLLTWERLVADGITLASGVSLPDAARMEVAFDLFDKGEQLLGYFKSNNRSGKGFKRMMRKGEMLPVLRRSFANLPDRPRQRFEKHSRRVYESFYEEMRSGVLPGRLTPGGVKVGQGTAEHLVDVTTEQFVADFARDLRNSAHGFMEQLQGDARFRVAVHDGTMPTQIGDIAKLIMLGFGGGAQELVAGTWL